MEDVMSGPDSEVPAVRLERERRGRIHGDLGRRRDDVQLHLSETIVPDADPPLRIPLEIAHKCVREGVRRLDANDVLNEERDRPKRRPAAKAVPRSATPAICSKAASSAAPSPKASSPRTSMRRYTMNTNGRGSGSQKRTD